MCAWAAQKGWCEAAKSTVPVVPDRTSGGPVASGRSCDPALYMKGDTGLERMGKSASAPSCVSLVHQPTFIVDFEGKRDYFMLGNFLPTMRSLLLGRLTRTRTLSLALTLTLINSQAKPRMLTPTRLFYKSVASCGDRGWDNHVLVKGAYKKEDTLFNWLQIVATNCVRYVEDILLVWLPDP